MTPYRFTLYIAGQATRSQRAVANLNKACERVGRSCEICIIDILENPEAAERDKVLAIPTLIKRSPAPMRRVIGDLSSEETLIDVLDIKPPRKRKQA